MSLVKFHARNHRQQIGKRGTDTQVDDRATTALSGVWLAITTEKPAPETKPGSVPYNQFPPGY